MARDGVTQAVARARLGLSTEQVRLAVELGWLPIFRSGRIDARGLEAFEAELASWLPKLAAEKRLNVTKATARLGVTRTAFARAVDAGVIAHVATGSWRYGEIRFYRAADVDGIADWLAEDAAARAATVVDRRREAACKAAATRRANAAAREAALAVAPPATAAPRGQRASGTLAVTVRPGVARPSAAQQGAEQQGAEQQGAEQQGAKQQRGALRAARAKVAKRKKKHGARPVPLSNEKTAAALGIPQAVLRVAVTANLLVRVNGGGWKADVFTAALDDPAGFRARLGAWAQARLDKMQAGAEVAGDPVGALVWAAGVYFGAGGQAPGLAWLRAEQQVQAVITLAHAAGWDPAQARDWAARGERAAVEAMTRLVHATEAAAGLQVMPSALTDHLPTLGGWVPRAGVEALQTPAGAARLAAARTEFGAWQPRGMPVRRGPLGDVVFHAGPTNSGKTHDALEALAQAGAGVYAAPLRQLAYEAYLRLTAQLPEGLVGLSTGEEEINGDAPVICCTTEKAPTRGRVLVLDEAHWITDLDRGHHWTRLLLAGAYEQMQVICAPEALPMLQPLVGDAASVRVVEHRRLSALHWQAQVVTASTIEPRTLVVAFSRNAVYAVAAQLHKHRPGRVGVLYGALPPDTRRAVIDQFISGALDVLVTTDVIGHGINLPAQTVLFAETKKFDGQDIRPLRSWEAAQIAGRAGRFGYGEDGTVGVYSGVTGLSVSPRLVDHAVAVARGDAPSDLPKALPRLRPVLEDLRALTAADLEVALGSWQAWATKATQGLPVTTDTIADYRTRLAALAGNPSGVLLPDTDASVGWRLLNLPVDYDPPRRTRWLTLARAALAHQHGQPVDPSVVLPSLPTRGVIAVFEGIAAQARDAAAMLRTFPGVGGWTVEDARDVERRAAQEITARLPEEIRTSRAGTCTQCGGPSAPWYSTCQSCHRGSSRWDDWY